jgi:hypothetical protein
MPQGIPHVFTPGQRFGKLTVVRPAGSERQNGNRFWACVCDCGNEHAVTAVHLAGGYVKSCGCNRAGQRTHGYTGSRVYRIWKLMKSRCSNLNLQGADRYVGRGITYDPRWERFENFLEDMGEPPTGLSLERKDYNGPYSKANCEWATSMKQGRNKSTNRYIEFDGRKQTLSEWSRETGVSVSTMRYRLQSGWPRDKVFLRERFHAVSQFRAGGSP